MKCKCDSIMELDPLHPENEYCSIHDVGFLDEGDDLEEGQHEEGQYEWGTRIILNESDLDEIYN